MLRGVVVCLAILIAGGCGRDELVVHSRISATATLEIRAPLEGLEGPCDVGFADRFCQEEFEGLGTVQIGGGERRVLSLSDDFDETCTNLLWLRLISLDDVGPVPDPGTLFELPAEVDLSEGAGALHTVAFPQATVRLDERGPADPRQSAPPPSCTDLGRAPRTP